MMDQSQSSIVTNPWQELRRFTQARIALGRAGVSTPTDPHLDFQLAHALARDAVYQSLAIENLSVQLSQLIQEPLTLESLAPNRQVYLQRPDLGRRLSYSSRQKLEDYRTSDVSGYDAVFVIADGLSARAIEENAIPFLTEMLPRLDADTWRLAPPVIVEQGRVAIGDEIGAVLDAKLAVVLIGERPGLSSPNSMGVYMTFAPQVGRTDAERNCISNVRSAGLSPAHAAFRLHHLMIQSRNRRLSGVLLKDDSKVPSDPSFRSISES